MYSHELIWTGPALQKPAVHGTSHSARLAPYKQDLQGRPLNLLAVTSFIE